MVHHGGLSSGGCDRLEMKSGCLTNDKKSAVIYRGIENIFGNIAQFCDGINFNGGELYITNDRKNYMSDKIDNPYFKLSYICPSQKEYIKEIGYDENNPAIQIPITLGGTESTYITDNQYGANSGKHILLVGGTHGDKLYSGLWHFDWGSGSINTYEYYGGRLLYIPN